MLLALDVNDCLVHFSSLYVSHFPLLKGLWLTASARRHAADVVKGKCWLKQVIVSLCRCHLKDPANSMSQQVSACQFEITFIFNLCWALAMYGVSLKKSCKNDLTLLRLLKTTAYWWSKCRSSAAAVVLETIDGCRSIVCSWLCRVFEKSYLRCDQGKSTRLVSVLPRVSE